MGFFSGILGDDSAGDAIKDLRKEIARISEENKFEPFDVDSPLFSTSFQDKTATTSLKPAAASTFADFNKAIDSLGSSATDLDQTGLAVDFFNMIDALESEKENRAFNSFESKLFNTSGVHTGSAAQIGDFQNLLEAGRQSRQFNAINAAQGFTTNLFNNFLALNQGRTALNAAAINPLSLGINFGQAQSQANTPFINAAFGAADIAAAHTANQGFNFGSLIDDALGFGADFLFPGSGSILRSSGGIV